jgi:hypothetical protein
VWRRFAGGQRAFVEAPAPFDEGVQSLLRRIIGRMVAMLTRRGSVLFHLKNTHRPHG